jgi:hypothetical protein|tara:strand:- start:181 stop:381 length:201 start_codon:yes stop_codon:yes gene_type:complete
MFILSVFYSFRNCLKDTKLYSYFFQAETVTKDKTTYLKTPDGRAGHPQKIAISNINTVYRWNNIPF